MKDSKTSAEKNKATAPKSAKAKGSEETVTSAKDAKDVNTEKKKGSK